MVVWWIFLCKLKHLPFSVWVVCSLTVHSMWVTCTVLILSRIVSLLLCNNCLMGTFYACYRHIDCHSGEKLPAAENTIDRFPSFVSVHIRIWLEGKLTLKWESFCIWSCFDRFNRLSDGHWRGPRFPQPSHHHNSLGPGSGHHLHGGGIGDDLSSVEKQSS